MAGDKLLPHIRAESPILRSSIHTHFTGRRGFHPWHRPPRAVLTFVLPCFIFYCKKKIKNFLDFFADPPILSQIVSNLYQNWVKPQIILTINPHVQEPLFLLNEVFYPPHVPRTASFKVSGTTISK